MRVVYADVLFAVNFAADFLVLYACGKLLSLKIRFARLLCACALGALYAVADTVFIPPAAISLFFGIAVSYIMCLVSYSVSRFSAQLRLLLLFYVCSAILGGGMQAAMYALIRLFGRTGLFKEGISFQTFAVLSGVLSAAAVAAGRIFKSGRPSKRVEADISFRNGLSERFCFICDTGNVLTDPYSGSPVIVMSAKAAERLKGLDLQTLLCDKTPDGNAAIDAHFRYIPARSACGTRVFPAFRPESIELIVNGKNIKADAVIALDADKSNTYCGTDGILPAELVENI